MTKNGFAHILQLDNINHPIEMRLISLEQISIILTIKFSANFQYNFATTLDPRSIPSNFYMQNCQELIPCFDTLYYNCYAFLQIYIKDSCDTDFIENSVP